MDSAEALRAFVLVQGILIFSASSKVLRIYTSYCGSTHVVVNELFVARDDGTLRFGLDFLTRELLHQGSPYQL